MRSVPVNVTPSRDSLWGAENVAMLAGVHLRVGEKDRAIAEFARLLQVPHGANVNIARLRGQDPLTSISWIAALDDPSPEVVRYAARRGIIQ